MPALGLPSVAASDCHHCTGGGAAPFRVKVAVEEVPPVTVVGFSASEVNEATVTVA